MARRELRKAWFTFDDDAAREFGKNLWYFGLPDRTPGPPLNAPSLPVTMEE